MISLYQNLYDDKRLLSRAKIVYINLKDRADKEGKCFPSLARISKDTSLSKRTVQRAIDDLIFYGYIKKEARCREYDKGDTSNFYYIK
ncbi:MAG: helix-turn-helix domain-containing protein [Clostridia bacterium]